jgi:hypothetical protein
MSLGPQIIMGLLHGLGLTAKWGRPLVSPVAPVDRSSAYALSRYRSCFLLQHGHNTIVASKP